MATLARADSAHSQSLLIEQLPAVDKRMPSVLSCDADRCSGAVPLLFRRVVVVYAATARFRPSDQSWQLELAIRPDRSTPNGTPQRLTAQTMPAALRKGGSEIIALYASLNAARDQPDGGGTPIVEPFYRPRSRVAAAIRLTPPPPPAPARAARQRR
jgi:hypothetical protein